VHVIPACPWTQTVLHGERHVQGGNCDTPKHLDQRHGHEAEVAGGSEGRVGVLEVSGECYTTVPEVSECQRWRYMVIDKAIGKRMNG